MVVSNGNKDSEHDASNALSLVSGSILLMADCLGTGILALPYDVKVLGGWGGIFFIIINLPINLYAGTILSTVASTVETDVNDEEADDTKWESHDEKDHVLGSSNVKLKKNSTHHQHGHVDDDATHDFVELTKAIFNSTFSYTPKIVTITYYINIFLVLGNYILVMSHSVQAFIGEDLICTPKAGLIASTMMFALSQLNTMAKLGRWVSFLSLFSLFIVVVQCLNAAYYNNEAFPQQGKDTQSFDERADFGTMHRLAATSSIGFAVGSQKLLLNIRHEMKNRNESPKSLAIALLGFGSAYVFVSLMAGENPPSFLLDAIPSGLNRRIAGFMLWFHVSVSYAINSQALTSSLVRLMKQRDQHAHTIIENNTVELQDVTDEDEDKDLQEDSQCVTEEVDLSPHQSRGSPPPPASASKLEWFFLTLTISISSYIVANAIPFFKDLVSLTGALTSVPLTLLLPSILYRRGYLGRTRYLWVARNWNDSKDVLSFLLVVYSLLFMICGFCGAIYSIDMDWKSKHSGPFSCVLKEN